MFIFYFLGVGPPRRSIFCQLWLCEEAQCVYLYRHLGSPKIIFKKENLMNIPYLKKKRARTWGAAMSWEADKRPDGAVLG